MAASVAAPATVAIPPLFSAAWFDGVKYGAQVEGGFWCNGDRPVDGLNIGQLTTSHASPAQLNQILASVQRVTDPKPTGYGFGFAFEAVHGSDVRFYHSVDEPDRTISSRHPLGVIRTNVPAHLPWLTPGGPDVKTGQFPIRIAFGTTSPWPCRSARIPASATTGCRSWTPACWAPRTSTTRPTYGAGWSGSRPLAGHAA